MANFVKGDMWSIYGNTDLFLVTTNPIVNKQGELVMGRGIAKQMADNFPGAAQEYAKMTRIGLPSPYVGYRYCEPLFGKQRVGYFMVKDHWRSPARLDIIMRSTADLLTQASSLGRVDLNFPGIGNGRLSREQVKPILDILPDNVYIWEYA